MVAVRTTDLRVAIAIAIAKEKKIKKEIFKKCNNFIYIYIYMYILHDHPSYLCCPDALNLVGDPPSGNGCGSPKHIEF